MFASNWLLAFGQTWRLWLVVLVLVVLTIRKLARDRARMESPDEWDEDPAEQRGSSRRGP